ncbi:MAG: type II toxin-antitoxin system VapC family toxin [Candidatus Nanohaloarchaea archaeon]
MVFIDSNILCYFFDSSAEEHEAVVDRMEQLIDSEEDLHVNTVVLMEVAHFLVKNLGGKKGEQKLDEMLQYPFKVTDLDYSLTREAVEKLSMHHQTGIGGRDATIIASMKQEGIQTLVTHDQAFKKVQEIDVEDPVDV